MEQPAEYKLVCGSQLMDKSVIHDYVSRSYWAEGIPRAVMDKAIDNALCFGVFKADEQVAFARLITDGATFAYLADVFVLEEHRGKGLSKLMMDKIISHPELQGLRRMMLATRDAHGLYLKYGFTPLVAPDTFMQLWQPNVYG
ncbi:GNAT family N-acetyltransferase [Shewanella submarina]|uniref:GNAT family N-acetyltransferase n=1 Tax=Shewanella submarina TaxID=2016376 RepID=A0ABV7GA57_9GAMM|nr:GNAT family N-acetyltransferase [Shewanella submarina]MCL1037540.1 GNAT family N-acetyltransferase [Shewanella submarina]